MTGLVRSFNDGGSFESAASQHADGRVTWSARDFMARLGYDNFRAFEKVALNRAIGTCSTLGIAVTDHFRQSSSPEGLDYELSRFACYLIAMNGDIRKPQVAAAQAYFVAAAEAIRLYAQSANEIDRILVRDEIAGRSRSLSSTAKQRGVDRFHLFHDAGYLGMYNMHVRQLMDYKGMPDAGRSLLDFMDKRELAANLFRLAETEERLKMSPTRGQRPAEQIATTVGRKVRHMMMEDGGSAPEDIPLAQDIKAVQRSLKRTEKEFAKLNSQSKPATAQRLPLAAGQSRPRARLNRAQAASD